MSIVILRVPETTNTSHSGMPDAVLTNLSKHSACAGKTLMMKLCNSEPELIASLQRADSANAEFVLMDPGSCNGASADLSSALREMITPYIEVHDDDFGTLESALEPGYGPRFKLIQGYGAHSYSLALSIALEHLGCGECESDVHVGT